MTERPILFSAPMVRAILDGSKTQTRRAVRKQFAADAEPAEVAATSPEGWQMSGHTGLWWDDAGACVDDAIRCPYGIPGDRLWVRETWLKTNPWSEDGVHTYGYRASDAAEFPDAVWKPSIHMPRAASRITLQVTHVRVERLNSISDADAIAEGCTKNHNDYYWGGPHEVSGLKQMATAIGAYRDLWESINGPDSWAANPWVWVVQFKVIKKS